MNTINKMSNYSIEIIIDNLSTIDSHDLCVYITHQNSINQARILFSIRDILGTTYFEFIQEIIHSLINQKDEI